MSNYDANQVIADLEAQRDIGVKIPKKAIEYARQNPAEMTEYRDNGMSYSEIADLVVTLAR